MKINIVLPYKDSGIFYKNWANEENYIDFFHNFERASRCTLSYAALELKTYLEKLNKEFEVSVSEKSTDDFNISLCVLDNTSKDDDYEYKTSKNALTILGKGRSGVLYGVYDFLKLQGIMWLEPTSVGEYVPTNVTELTMPSDGTRETTGPEGRGFALDGELNESDDLAIWMARNKLNSYFIRPHTNKLMHKLGFKLCAGGHIFEKILHPDNILPSGKSIWEEHREWYGIPTDWEQKKENAMAVQFCVSNHELLTYLAEKLLEKINNEWAEADEINIWGFDTWGGICSCDKCKEIGTGTDQNIYMLSFFREYLNKARVDGRLNRDVKMILCLYEGTSTLEAPTKKIPESVIKAGDHCLFAPIVRCYDHYFDNEECSYNSLYYNALKNWNAIEERMPISILEYYNVTKFEDLPLLFLKTIKHDFVTYYNTGVRGYNYMHIPMVNWGIRALTQLIYAELSWNVNADIDSLIERYFNARYGIYASKMKDVYMHIEKSSSTISSWREWKDRSVLTKLQWWNGEVPTSPLEVDDHFKTVDNLIKDGLRIVNELEEAYSLLNEVIISEKNNVSNVIINNGHAVNPIELLKAQNKNKLVRYLLDDKRGLYYAIDVWKMMLLCSKYHNYLYLKDEDSANKVWIEIETLEDKMESYYMPIKYSNGCLSIISVDALTRSQLNDTINKCRAFRVRTNRNVK